MKLANNKLMQTVTKHGGEMVRYLSKNSPTILTGCAIAGAFVAVGLAVKATKPALEHIKAEKEEHRDRIIIKNGDEREDYDLTEEEIDAIQLRPTEVVKAVWKDYLPTGIVLAGTTACIIGAHSISAKRTAAMAALYTMSEQALKDYKGKAEEIVGKKKAVEITDAAAEEALKRTPYNPATAGFSCKPGEVPCCDLETGRYWPCNADRIKAACDRLKARIYAGERVTQNDFYYEVGLDGVKHGDDKGWCVENEIDLELTSSLTSEGVPVLAVGFRNAPTMWYY